MRDRSLGDAGRRRGQDRSKDRGQRKGRTRTAHLLRLLSTSFALARRIASLARNLATRSMSLTGTGSENGKRNVPLLTLYVVRAPLKAATSSSLAGYSE